VGFRGDTGDGIGNPVDPLAVFFNSACRLQQGRHALVSVLDQAGGRSSLLGGLACRACCITNRLAGLLHGFSDLVEVVDLDLRTLGHLTDRAAGLGCTAGHLGRVLGELPQGSAGFVHQLIEGFRRTAELIVHVMSVAPGEIERPGDILQQSGKLGDRRNDMVPHEIGGQKGKKQEACDRTDDDEVPCVLKLDQDITALIEDAIERRVGFINGRKVIVKPGGQHLDTITDLGKLVISGRCHTQRQRDSNEHGQIQLRADRHGFQHERSPMTGGEPCPRLHRSQSVISQVNAAMKHHKGALCLWSRRTRCVV